VPKTAWGTQEKSSFGQTGLAIDLSFCPVTSAVALKRCYFLGSRAVCSINARSDISVIELMF
jgi:hypothetical protein